MVKKNVPGMLFLLLVFAFFITLLLALYGLHTVNRDAPTAQQGVLDLRDWHFENDGMLMLDGQWAYYEQQLLTPEDFRQPDIPQPTHYLNVPGTWGGLDKQNDIDAKSYGTYRLQILTAQREDVLALIIRNIRFSNQLYINDQFLGKSGIPGGDQDQFSPGNTPYLAYFDNAGEQIEILIQVANFVFPTGGIINAIPLGTAEDITTFSHIRLGIDMSLILLLVFFGTYCFILYNFSKRQISYLLIGVYMLTIALNHSLYNEKIFQRILPDLSFSAVYELQEFAQFASGVIFWHFIASFGIRLLPGRWTHAALYPIYMYLAAVLFLPYSVHIQFKYGFAIYMALIPLFVLFRLLHIFYTKRGQRQQLLLVIGACFTLEGYLVSIYMYAENLLTSDLLNKCFLIAFILFMLLVLTSRYAQSQAQSEELSHQLMLSNQLKDEFLLNTSHELKTPLHGVRNLAASLLEDAAEQLTPKQRQQMWLIEDTSMKLSMLVQDLIDVSSLKHGKLQLNPTAVDVRVAVDIVLEMLSFELAGKPVRMENCVAPLTVVRADENRLRQVLYNLVHNAIKHTKQGTICVQSQVSHEYAAITIIDTGIGIPHDKHETIFHYFEQIEEARPQDGYTGMGVGLYISRKLVELMGGTVSVAWSEVDKGTSMRLKLPIAPTFDVLSETAVSRSGGTRPIWPDTPLEIWGDHAYTILVVDDEASNVHSLLTILRKHAYNVITAFSAQEALLKMEQHHKIDLVILDVMMPETSGIALCRTLRAKHSILNLPILFATVKDAPHDVALGFRAGANDYITKPFDGETLAARIQTLLAMKTSIQEAIHNELAFHQAQIKPHFLYNALSSVISFCYVDGEKAAHLLTMLSRYLRYILDTDRTNLFSPLYQELELIEAYVEIEQTRFGDQFRFETIRDPDVQHVMIPSLCIQPFIENAIRHGLFDKDTPGLVTLSITKEHQHLLIMITDDGIGISEYQLQQIRLGTPVRGDGIGASGSGIAISNIMKRISALPQAAIDIQSEAGQGTCITMRLPLTRPGGSHD